MIYSKIQKNKGYTLLFSVLITSLLLAIGLAILMISQKELVLSSAGRESQFAFYAADTGLECAIYSDISKHGGKFNSGASTPSLQCNGQTITTTSELGPTLPSHTVIRFTLFNISLDSRGASLVPTAPCATVTVDKRTPSDSSKPVKTVVQSRGYNTCVTTDPRRLERGLQINY